MTAMTGGGLTGEMWSHALPTFEAIIAHPFLAGVTDGSLDAERFRHFVMQDSHYLEAYARGLTLAAAKARTGQELELLTGSASRAIAAEQTLHRELLDGLPSSGPAAAPGATPTTMAYRDFILANTALGSFGEALASVLACFWVYWEAGKILLARGSPNAVYQRWIDAYGGDEYGETVAAVLELVDSVGANASARERARMLALFAIGARYEWRFWDAAWRRESWPV